MSPARPYLFPMRRFSKWVCFLAALGVSLAGLTACGGSSGSEPPPPPPPPPNQDFTLSVSPSSLQLQQLGNAVQLTVSVSGVNGFDGTVTIAFQNAPAGITILPQGPYTAKPGQSLTVAFSATDAAAVGNTTITVQGVSGNHTHSAPLGLSVSEAIQFQLSISPSTVTIGPNGSATAQITLTPGANFGDNGVYLGFPSHFIRGTDIYMDVSPLSLTAAQPQATISLQSPFQAQSVNGIPVTITGSVGQQVVSVTLSLNIVNPAPACASASRSTTRRTDMDPTGVVYDPVRKLVFAAVDQTNTVEVYSSVNAHTVATIPIPAARQLDMTPDGSRLLVGSQTGYMNWVDPDTLQVTERVPVPFEIFNGSYAPQPLQPFTLANGKVLLVMSSFGGGGYSPYEWDPATNTYSYVVPPALSTSDLVLRRSQDHAHVVAFSSSGSLLSVFDSATDRFGPVINVPVAAAALNPNGSRMAIIGSSPSIPGGAQITLFDDQFNTLATYQANSQSPLNNLIFSRDGSLLYVFSGPTIVALNAHDLSFVGVVPNPAPSGVGYAPDVDETGMLFVPGLSRRSLVFTDASAPCALGINYPFNMALSPPQTSPSSPAATTLSAVGGLTVSSQIFFGAPPGSPQATPGTNLVYSPPGNMQVTPPAATGAGVVNVTVTNPDGWVALVPDGFSYGSNVLHVTPNSGPSAGGTSVTLYGYGFAFDKSQIQVTVGGNPATVTDAFAGPGISPFPFPMHQVKFTTPAGIAGSADIVITTPVGSATVHNGFHYLTSAQNYPVSANLAQVVYDQTRQRLYSTDFVANQVRIFDLASHQSLAPILVGRVPVGLALTPDRAALVVANAVDSSISIIDLAGGTGIKTVSMVNLSSLPQFCGPPIPFAVATTTKNQAVIAIQCTDIAVGQLVVLDLTTQTFGCGASAACAAMVANYNPVVSYYLFLAATPDGSKVFATNGALGLWDVNADTFTTEPLGSPGNTFGVLTAISDDGMFLSQYLAIIDPSLRVPSWMQDPDYYLSGIFGPYWVPGEKLHPSGALLYVPTATGLDIYDSHQGRLVRRVSLPQQVASTFDALALNETGAQAFLISSSGLTIVNIPDLPLSLGSLSPAQGPAAGGTTVRIRGSNFQNGAKVMFGNVQATVSFVDSTTLQAVTPSLPVGATRVTVVNPDNTQYSLDAAFTAQ